MKKLIMISMLVAIFLGGCKSQPMAPNVNDATANELAEAARSVSLSLQELAEVTQAANPQAIITPPPNPRAYGMDGLASIDWSGPIEPLMKRIATATHYHLQVLGTTPGIPVIITISAVDTPFSDIIRDTGFQAGKRATIIVFPSTKTIQLRYARV